METIKKEAIAEWFQSLQNEICEGMEQADGKGKFKEDLWERAGGGGGRTRILAHGDVIEKGGVNFSAVHGPMPEKIMAALNLSEGDFFASGVSIVMHPFNPWVPIIHMNIRYFEMSDGTWWFGGGIDLTPHYVNPEDAKFFHTSLKDACDQYHPGYYPEFKAWADDYFFIKHRNETRGIGGIFFDKVAKDKMKDFEFVKGVGTTFLPVYTHLIQKNKQQSYSPEEKEWQMIRRGRYVEFNLVYDKGTRFGLDTEGRTESILMSLPEQAKWLYNHSPAENSREAQTLRFLKKGLNWVE